MPMPFSAAGQALVLNSLPGLGTALGRLRTTPRSCARSGCWSKCSSVACWHRRLCCGAEFVLAAIRRGPRLLRSNNDVQQIGQCSFRHRDGAERGDAPGRMQ